MRFFLHLLAPIAVNALHGIVDALASTAKITIAKAAQKAVPGITIDFGNAP